MNISFLSGLPRSGSTLLGTLLSQRTDVSVSATSGLIDIMGASAVTWESSPQFKSGDVTVEALYPVLRAMMEAHYNGADGTVLDKSRGWPDPKVMGTMAKVIGSQPKIIATVRPIAECLASFIKISKFDGAVKDFVKKSPLARHLFFSYATLKAGYEASPDSFLFIEYADLVADPQRQCDRVADFLELPRFQHMLTGLFNPVPERDAETWGIPGLHHVRPTIERQPINAKDVLGDKLFAFYQGGEFWKEEPKHEPAVKQVIELQLEASLRGDFEVGWRLCQIADPDDERAMFNKGWYLLRQGKLREGMHLLARGRNEGVFGNPAPSSMPVWDGRKLNGETVLFNCEGGLGDSICNARFARDIAARGGNVVLACAAEIAPVLATVDGVSAVVESAAAGGVYHQYWVPAMSAAGILGLEYSDLDDSPFIPNPLSGVGNKSTWVGKPRVGIRWAGNPKFEHEQHRKFDPAPLFDLRGVDLVSLQKDWAEPLPSHIITPKLETWEHTAAEIAKCDLIISSCTAVAHLAAAMGKPTWVIVPILPYYIWALPGTASPWYRSVRLFRQTVYGDWSGAFSELNAAFAAWHDGEARAVA